MHIFEIRKNRNIYIYMWSIVIGFFDARMENIIKIQIFETLYFVARENMKGLYMLLRLKEKNQLKCYRHKSYL